MLKEFDQVDLTCITLAAMKVGWVMGMKNESSDDLLELARGLAQSVMDIDDEWQVAYRNQLAEILMDLVDTQHKGNT